MHHPLKPRILCIDDEPPVGELIRALLESSGDFLVDVETKAISAVTRARLFRPDLVLLDIKMPGLDGFALAQNLRMEPWLKHRPILFFSGMSNVQDSVQRAWRSGPTEFLEKGVPSSVIEGTIRRILAERIQQYRASLSSKS